MPAGCSATYDPVLVDILGKVARVGARSALTDYCRSFADERGRRPTAAQAYEAGYNPASVRARHGHWFGFLQDLDLLNAAESEVVERYADILAGFEKEPITKSYKLVTISALLQLNALRTGASISEIAWAAHQIVSGDPRLLADTRSADMPDPAGAAADSWRDYWVRWPLSAWSGRLRGASSGWFILDNRRFAPTFSVENKLGDTFDRMVEEIVDYRYARYLLSKDTGPGEAAMLNVIQANGRPILMLNRARNPNLPEGETPFVATDIAYVGNFVKIALNVAHREGSPDNALPELLRSWFGPAAGQPGTSHQVELVKKKDGWEMRPVLRRASGQESTA